MIFVGLDLASYPKAQVINLIKYSSILFCLLAAGILTVQTKNNTAVFLTAAFLFTAVSDYILIFMNAFTLGVCTFFLAQSIHFCRIGRLKEWKKSKFIMMILFRAGIAVFLIFLFSFQDAILIIGVFYAVNLVGNLVESMSGSIRMKKQSLTVLSVGFFLFLLCDMNVALYNLNAITSARVASIIWLFYLPSQVLLVWSEIVIGEKEFT